MVWQCAVVSLMLPRQNPAQDHDTSKTKNDYPLHDLESQSHNLPPQQDSRKVTAKGKENHAGSTKVTRDEETTKTRIAAIPGKKSKQTYFDAMPIVLVRSKTKSAVSFHDYELILTLVQRRRQRRSNTRKGKGLTRRVARSLVGRQKRKK